MEKKKINPREVREVKKEEGKREFELSFPRETIRVTVQKEDIDRPVSRQGGNRDHTIFVSSIEDETCQEVLAGFVLKCRPRDVKIKS